MSCEKEIFSRRKTADAEQADLEDLKQIELLEKQVKNNK
ncbi:hypothetical protein CCAND38_450038 [Capnocytophaga canis]|uniref:Uncharacterized protein n=1 Tax=Capnocytophaga canis TaxID=1848903 RepID=A0A0B7I797_9FLAO|nr:hypothetical protein CCAND38_450038 [Capnocytophaga canis]